MKIVLISNPTTIKQKPDFPPIGIAYLGAIAKEDGHDVLLIDGGLESIEKIAAKTKEFMPDLVGITCWTIGRGKVWELCSALESELLKATLVIGGPHATILPKQVFKKTFASIVVIGEGEETFRELLLSLGKGGDLSSVAGLYFKDKNGKPQCTSVRSAVEDLDTIPFPFYKGFKGLNFSMYNGFPWLKGPTAAIISSRGCVFNCSYCASVQFWGKRWRFRSPENIIAEVKWLADEFGIKSIFFYDDNFLVDKTRAISICHGIAAIKPEIEWSCCSHVKMVDADLLKIMKASGCINIDFGVESGSNKLLKTINKKQTRNDIIKAFELVHAAGIATRAYLIVGIPGETEGTIDETIDLVGRIKPLSLGANILWLLPGTKEYDDAIKNGFISENYWLENDDVPYNLQDYSLSDIQKLRSRLMRGVAKNIGGLNSKIACYLKDLYYKYPKLSVFRSIIPKRFH